MNRAEKNQQTRSRIINNALLEFSEKGYSGSSINTISASEGLSKGIIYHYFDTKDDLYLSCVEECFKALTEYLNENVSIKNNDIENQMESYFNARLVFFKENPIYQRIFCGVVINPPEHLESRVLERKNIFDSFNTEILNKLLDPLPLRSDISREEVVETVKQYQDYINAKYQMSGANKIDIDEHEKSCHRALNILLYGVIARGI